MFDKKWLARVVCVLAVIGILGAIYAMRPPALPKPSSEIQGAVTAIRRQADVVRLAYGRLRVKGCAEAEISFAAAGLRDHDNPHARPKHTCDIFDPAGAAVRYQNPPAEILDRSFAASPGFGVWRYSFDNDVAGIGTQPCAGAPRFRDCDDLIAFVPISE